MSKPTTPVLPRRGIWDNLSGNFSTPCTSQPTTPLLSRRNIPAHGSPRDTNPFRAEQMDRNVLDRSSSKADFATAPSYSMDTYDSHQSDWFTKQNQRNIVDRTTDVSRPIEMSKFEAMPVNYGMPTSACPKEDTNGTCQTGAHPKNPQSPDQNGNGPPVNGNCFFLQLQLSIWEYQCFNLLAFPILGHMSVGQAITVIPSAVVSCDEIYVQLSSSADQLIELQRKLNQFVVIRNVTKLPSKFYSNPIICSRV